MLDAFVLMFAALLVFAGSTKVARPHGTRRALRLAGLPSGLHLARLVGMAEVTAGLVALVVGGRSAGILLAGTYATFAAFTAVQRVRASDAPCGCFGSEKTPATWPHVAVNTVATGVGIVAIVLPPPSVPDLVAAQPLVVLVASVLVAVNIGLLRTALTLLPELADVLAAHPPGTEV